MFSLTQTQLIIYAVVVTLAFGGGYKLRGYRVQAEELSRTSKALEGVQKALIARNLLETSDAMKSRTLEDTIAAIHESKQEAQIVREKEYVEKPVYIQCVVPPNGLRLLNDRIAARHTAADTGKR